METIIRKTKFQFSDKTKDHVILGICLICMALFLYTACSKILDHARFLSGLSRVELTSKFAGYIAWLVPAAEILIAALLLIPKTCKWGLYAFATLMILFTCYILGMLFWATNLPCHCGGAIEKLSWTQHVWFNLVFIGLPIFALQLIKHKN
jgi:hypothetical protein